MNTSTNTLLSSENYHGFVGRKKFEIFVVATIIIASIITGLKTYDLSNHSLKIINTLDLLICTLFALEIALRIITAKNKIKFFFNAWNIFDILIIALLLLPTDTVDLAAFGRIIRIIRILRLLTIVPQLRTLTSALFRSLPQLFYVIVMMFVVFYIYAAIGSTFFGVINKDLWGNIGISMLTLFRIMTFEDWTDVMYETMNIYPASCFYYISFIFITAFATLNLVIGIMTASLEGEQIDDAQKENKEDFDKINSKIDALIESIKHIKP